MIICTLDYLTKFYNDEAIKKGYNSINVEEDNYKTLPYELLLVEKNSRYGITDLEFNEKVGTKYDTIKFNECCNEFIVSSGSRYGIIDKDGNVKVNLIYDEVSIINYEPLLYKVKTDNKYGIINEAGELITNEGYETIGFERSDKDSLEQSVVIIPKLDDNIDTSIVVKNSSGYGLIDAKTGKEIVECSLDKIYTVFGDGELKYEAIFKDQRVDLIQYIRTVSMIVVNM